MQPEVKLASVLVSTIVRKPIWEHGKAALYAVKGARLHPISFRTRKLHHAHIKLLRERLSKGEYH
ncbi:MAG: hypothetical protein ACFFCQ_01795 [Promethearchaeota archaeon]